MIEQRRSIFDALLLEVIIPWLILVNWRWALRLTRFRIREMVPPVPALVPEAPDPGRVTRMR